MIYIFEDFRRINPFFYAKHMIRVHFFEALYTLLKETSRSGFHPNR